MIYRRSTIAMLLAVTVSSSVAAMPARILGADPFANHYVSCDMTTGNITIERVFSSTMTTPTGGIGLSTHPLTNDIYILAKLSAVAGRVLGTLNFDTGLITVIGNTGDNFSSITFDGTGVLWATTGDGAAVPETLWTLDIATAMPTMVRALGSGADGETIIWSPVTNQLFHCSGNGTVIFESINIVSPFTVTNIPITGMTSGEIFGMLWDTAAGVIITSNISSTFDVVTTAGLFTPTGLVTDPMGVFNTDDMRGLVDLATSCAITAPITGASVSGDVSITFDATTPGNGGLDLIFEYSTNGGMSWNGATAAAASTLANPTLMAPSPVAATFVWDSTADGVGMAGPQATDLRVRTRNSLDGTGVCVVTGVMVGGCALCGDCDLNMITPTILDALAAAQIAVGLFIPTMQQMLCCDADSSMTVSTIDALLVAQDAAGLTVVLNCP